jgi:hypothetical protein
MVALWVGLGIVIGIALTFCGFVLYDIWLIWTCR